MEFSEKLQELRKKKNLTQEELANALFVSRTAISKWESGRGYPSIDSLKEISRYFCVSIDELICADEIVSAAVSEKQDYKESIKWLIKIVNEKKEELDNIRNHSLITAYRELGKIYRDCKEVQNNELSIKYFMQAARLGADVTSDIKKLYIKQ